MNSLLKKINLALLSVLFAGTYVYSAGVNEAELKSASGQIIQFENYNGPHKVVDTLDQIKSIGSGIGRQLKNGGTSAGTTGKYYVIHATDPSQQDKLEADIFIIGENAGVDHIRNLRHIIAAYLSEYYGYSDADAHTIATFVTVYNAVYRNKMDYFQSKYKKVVTDKLSSDKCGLAITYKEWPGRSQIVIPLGDGKGLSSVDTSVISDKKVVESMKEENDKGIDERKNMVDIKEREAEQSQKDAQQAQKQASKEEEKLKEEKKELQEKKEEAAQAQKQAEEAEKKAQENPDDKKAAQEAKDKREEAEQAEEEVKKQEEEVNRQQEKTDEAKQQASQQQAKADKKQNEAQNERQEIAKDQKELIKDEINESVNSAYALKLTDEKALLSQIVKVDRRNSNIIRESPVKVIHNRMVYRQGTDYIAVAGVNASNGAVKLIKIDAQSLEMTAESDEILSDNSVLVQNGSSYYCILNEKGKYYTACFDSDLKLVKKSDVEVNPSTPIFIGAEGIFVTDKNSNVKILDASTLSLK